MPLLSKNVVTRSARDACLDGLGGFETASALQLMNNQECFGVFLQSNPKTALQILEQHCDG